jgi:hypothetical protein
MTDITKIALSANELELVCNKEWILTKQIVIEKVYQLFGSLALSMQQYVQEESGNLPAAILLNAPKISRGENYLKLPYVMLDYPRYFTKDNTVAIRTFFWWGNFFSINLHLSGKYKAAAVDSLIDIFSVLQQKEYAVCCNEDPWEHHFETDNFLPVKKITPNDFAIMLNRKPFIKIAKQINLQQWDAAGDLLIDHFIEMMKFLKINFPGDERGL